MKKWIPFFLLVLLSFSAQSFGQGTGTPDPWPTHSRHYTLTNFPTIADSLIAASCTGTNPRHCVWPSWDGAHFQLAHSVRTDDVWSAVTYVTSSSTDNLQPALALISGAPNVVYSYGSTVRAAIKGSSWTTYHLANSTAETIAAHQESGHTWWTWREGSVAKWIEYTGTGWSTVGTLTISTDYAAAVASIRNTVLGL